MHASNKVFDFSSFLHLALPLSWKIREKADRLRKMSQRQHGRQYERMVQSREAYY